MNNLTKQLVKLSLKQKQKQNKYPSNIPPLPYELNSSIESYNNTTSSKKSSSVTRVKPTSSKKVNFGEFQYYNKTSSKKSSSVKRGTPTSSNKVNFGEFQYYSNNKNKNTIREKKKKCSVYGSC